MIVFSSFQLAVYQMAFHWMTYCWAFPCHGMRISRMYFTGSICIEAYGTGIPKIMRSYTGCTRKPELQATSNAFKITLPNRNLSNYKATVREAALTENEEKVIDLLDKHGEIVRKDVEARLTVSQAMAVRILRGLLDKEIIRAIGGGKKTRYVKSSGSNRYEYVAELR